MKFVNVIFSSITFRHSNVKNYGNGCIFVTNGIELNVTHEHTVIGIHVQKVHAICISKILFISRVFFFQNLNYSFAISIQM